MPAYTHGQVAHFDTLALRAPRAWVLGANASLPPDIVLTWGARDAAGVSCPLRGGCAHLSLSHPQSQRAFGARGQGVSHGCAGRSKIARMNAAAAHLLGEHDFSAFRATGCQSKTPLRRVTELAVRREGDHVTITVTANAFLHHMVRNITGLLISVGRGDAAPEFAAEVLAGRDRTRNAATAPAGGLYFAAVRYPREFAVPMGVSAMIPL